VGSDDIRRRPTSHSLTTPKATHASRRFFMDMKLELVPIPVADVDRAKQFYVEKLGFTEAVDVRPAEGVRVVQLTPPGSACSIGIGTGLAVYEEAAPGSIKGLHLVVADIERASADLLSRGVEVGPVEDVGG